MSLPVKGILYEKLELACWIDHMVNLAFGNFHLTNLCLRSSFLNFQVKNKIVMPLLPTYNDDQMQLHIYYNIMCLRDAL